MRPTRQILLAGLVVSGLFGPSSLAAVSTCEPDGSQASGAIYRICMPETWNGDLVLYAHGYVGFNEPVAIPEDQLVLPDGASVPELVNGLGYAFATTSYSTNGLAVLQGIDDLLDLVNIFNRGHGRARRVLLVGPSEGGIVTALAVERHPEVFSGGLAACGPIGSFRMQINYDGDFRVLFDYFFPGLFPSGTTSIPKEVIDDFDAVYVPRIQEAIRLHPEAARQLVNVARASTDTADPATIEETILGLGWYVVFGTNDATLKLGGQPFGNLFRYYMGSDNDPLLNQSVTRVMADASAVMAMQNAYETTGRLSVPLVTLHTTGDPIIPYWHETLYGLKTFLSGNCLKRHVNIAVPRYGHCNFKASEAVAGLAVLVFMVSQQPLPGVEAVLPDAASQAEYRTLVRASGARP